MTQYKFEGHYYRWTTIDTHTVNGVQYALAESDLGDEAPLILFKADRKKIVMKNFTNKITGEVTRLPFVPAELIIDDEVYDNIMIALEDNNIL